MSFFINGIETPVIVDEFVPIIEGTNDCMFAKLQNDELWVFLLEKAWAKLCGTYARTIAGSAYKATCHVLGVPSRIQMHKDISEEVLWSEIIEAEQRNFTMYTSTYGSGEVQSDLGIVSGHAYSLLSAIECEYEG